VGIIKPYLTNVINKIKEFKDANRCDLKTAKELVFHQACQIYYELTGYYESNADALYHHRLSIYGDECPSCGYLFRTPKAKFCTNCGFIKG
jgi:hypothetical protein